MGVLLPSRPGCPGSRWHMLTPSRPAHFSLELHVPTKRSRFFLNQTDIHPTLTVLSGGVRTRGVKSGPLSLFCDTLEGTAETQFVVQFMSPHRSLHGPETHILAFAWARAGSVFWVTHFLEPCFLVPSFTGWLRTCPVVPGSRFPL